MKNILLLVNPHARSGAGAYQSISEALKKAGHRVVKLSEEERAGNSQDLIQKYYENVDLVIIGGGDGSINHVLNALVKTKVPLLIYPLGTANLLARSFNIKPDVEELLENIKTGVEVKIDLGSVNDIYFINVCGLGISTEVNSKVSKTLKKLTGPLSFWITGLLLLRKLKPFRMKLCIDDQIPKEIRTWQLTVCNGRKYGAWMTIEPNASYDDGVLHCLSTEVTKTWQAFKLLPSYIKGSYKEDHEVNLLTAHKIEVSSKRPLKIDVDGDVQTKTPAVFEVHREAMKLIVPKEALSDSSPVNLENSHS